MDRRGDGPRSTRSGHPGKQILAVDSESKLKASYPPDHDEAEQSQVGIESREEGESRPGRPMDPIQWSHLKKWSILIAVSYVEFVTHLTSLMYAPGLLQVQNYFRDSQGVLTAMSMTIYVLGFAVGPLLFAPLTELYGRRTLYRLCTLLYLGFNIGCALSTNLNMLIAFRFFAGCFGSAPIAIGGAVVSDMFPTQHRGKAMSLYQLGPILGPLLGPVMGGYITQEKGWRWVFWISSILAAVSAILTFLMLKETYLPLLKRRAQNKAEIESGLENGQSDRGGASMQATGPPLNFEEDEKKTPKVILFAITRPIMMLLKAPLISICCLIALLNYGIMNFTFSTMGLVFQGIYKFTPGQSGLVYIGMAIGSIIGAIAFAKISDRIMIKLTRYHGMWNPHYRLPLMASGAFSLGAGLFTYGWTASHRVLWIVPIVGLAFIGFGVTTVHLAYCTFLVDTYTAYAASVLADVTILRSIGGSVLPLAGPTMYRDLGPGWANSVFAFLSIAICPITLLLYKDGGKNNFVGTRYVGT